MHDWKKESNWNRVPRMGWPGPLQVSKQDKAFQFLYVAQWGTTAINFRMPSESTNPHLKVWRRDPGREMQILLLSRGRKKKYTLFQYFWRPLKATGALQDEGGHCGNLCSVTPLKWESPSGFRNGRLILRNEHPLWYGQAAPPAQTVNAVVSTWAQVLPSQVCFVYDYDSVLGDTAGVVFFYKYTLHMLLYAYL